MKSKYKYIFQAPLKKISKKIYIQKVLICGLSKVCLLHHFSLPLPLPESICMELPIPDPPTYMHGKEKVIFKLTEGSMVL